MNIISRPTFFEEELLWKSGYTFVAGIDEVGRGSFAGPLVAAAVILPPEMPFQNLINDSKLLAPELRAKLSSVIKLYALAHSIVEIPVDTINRLGIGEAGQIAFTLCVQRLSKKPDFLLIDAFPIKKLKRKIQKPIIHGDSLSLSIAASSIIAKVHRDTLMEKLHYDYPEYNFKDNKGYGTEEHRTVIKQRGLCDLHRTSFDLSKFL